MILDKFRALRHFFLPEKEKFLTKKGIFSRVS
jgi:hypothetical protein